MLGTVEGKSMVADEVVPPGCAALGFDASDDEIEARIRATGVAHSHASGSAAMGKVVDGGSNVVGVQRLKVVNARVYAVGMGGHPQATLYALAERAAEVMLSEPS